MRLGLARLKFEPGGGAERTLELLARGLLARGHEVMAVTSDWKGERPQGLRVELVSPGSGGGKAQADRFAALALERMQAWGPDTWLALDKIPGAPIYRAGDGCHASWLERRAKYEPAWKRLGLRLDPKHKARLDLERRIFTAPELKMVIANSELVAREVSRYYGVDPGRISLIRNGVDEPALDGAASGQVRQEVRRELGLSIEEPVLLFLGSGFERKGLAFALDALARMDRGALLVAGKNSTRRYKAKAAKLGIGDRVRFLGLRTDAPRLMNACDVLVLPTIYDPCANVCLEALYMNRPVVTTSANGAAELVDQGVSGYIVDHPGDTPALAQSCEKALALLGPFEHRVPPADQWLDQVQDILEKTGS